MSQGWQVGASESKSTRTALAAVVLCLHILAAVQPAWALDPVKSAQSMARQAATAFEAGDHVRAAQLYEQAFTSDPATPEYLYGAARAEHVAGKLDLAEQHYNDYLSKAPGGPKAANAQKYLLEVRGAKAEQKASQAERAGRTDNWTLAAQLYHAAVDLAPHRVDLVFQEAMAEEQAGQKARAIALLEKYLQTAPATAADRGEATVRLAALKGPPGGATSKPVVPVRPEQPTSTQTPKPVEARDPAAAPVGVTKPPATAESSVALPWVIAAGGAALGITGVALAGWAASDRSSLENKLVPDAQTGLITGISESEAKAEQSSIDNRRIVAGVLGGVGLAAGAVGGWMLWKAYHPEAPARAAVLPTGNGVLFAVQF